MAAYLIVNIEITDRDRYAKYVELVPATLAKFGGRYLVRGGRAEKLEGSWEPKRVIVIEFDKIERAREWWESKEYSAAKALRQSCSLTDMILVEGV